MTSSKKTRAGSPKSLISPREALRASEERFRNLMDHIPGVSVQGYDLEGTVVYWNKASTRVYGYTAREAIGKNLADLIIPEKARPLFRQALDQGRKIRKSGKFLPPGELMLRHKKGYLVPVYSIHTAVYLKGQPILLFCIDVDLSARKRAEEALRRAYDEMEARVLERTEKLSRGNRELRRQIARRRRTEQDLLKSERRLKALLEATGDLIFVLEPPGIFREVISFSDDLLHLPQDQIQGRSYQEIFPPSLAELFSRHLKKVFSTRKPDIIEYQLPGSKGWFECRTTPCSRRGKSPPSAISVVRDITSRKEVEEACRRSENQLRQAQKMEAAGRLAAGVAHDFGNLLNAIQGYIAIFERRFKRSDPIRREIGELKEAVERADSLNRKLFTFGRYQPAQAEIINLNRLLNKMSGLLQKMGGKRVKLIFSPGGEPALVRIEAGQMEQVIVNLVLNACEAMERRGTIRIETGSRKVTTDEGEEGAALLPGSYLTMRVSDTGPGLSEESRSHLFEPFFTTKKKDRHTGLGLSIVYGIIRQNGGRILLEEPGGPGCVFLIYLPRIKPKRRG